VVTAPPLIAVVPGASVVSDASAVVPPTAAAKLVAPAVFHGQRRGAIDRGVESDRSRAAARHMVCAGDLNRIVVSLAAAGRDRTRKLGGAAAGPTRSPMPVKAAVSELAAE
jgi:hypothetical protein